MCFVVFVYFVVVAADCTIRKATSSDLPALGRLGALLMQVHYGFDPGRFMAPGDDAAIAWLRGAGMPRVVLWTADRNGGAQRLLERLGFRRTMVEMTKELP